jgi:hypothetical protein
MRTAARAWTRSSAPPASMKQEHLRFGEGFHVTIGNARAQAAQSVHALVPRRHRPPSVRSRKTSGRNLKHRRP